jgi:hypothetical protein
MPENTAVNAIKTALMQRFGEEFIVDSDLPGLDALKRMAGHRSQRRFGKLEVARLDNVDDDDVREAYRLQTQT